jgi:NAD(P)-dependent dehydrogenase (short-subunit alcohol dehydrogenase family)
MSLRECFNKAYDLNVSGTNVVTWTFIPLLLNSAEPRLIFLAGLSQMTQAAEAYFPTPSQPAGWPKKIDFETIGYRCSKTAMSMLMLDWNHKLKEDGVKVFSVSPGFCATGLGGLGADLMEAMGAEPPSEGGQRLIAVADLITHYKWCIVSFGSQHDKITIKGPDYHPFVLAPKQVLPSKIHCTILVIPDDIDAKGLGPVCVDYT